MRSFVLILMLALLPLRMWAADSMGIRMAQPPVAGMAADAMPEDCPMMASAMHTAPDGAGQGDHEGPPQSQHATCLACHLCAALAYSFPHAVRHATPAAPGERAPQLFASRDAPPELRPPIA